MMNVSSFLVVIFMVIIGATEVAYGGMHKGYGFGKQNVEGERI